jgi:polyferredoxin
VWVYSTILLLAMSGIVYGLTSLDAIQLKVLHERAPLFVTLSDGSIQNKYILKILNKLNEDLQLRVSASGPEHFELVGAEEPVTARNGFVSPAMLFVKIPRKQLQGERLDITFHVEGRRSDGQVVSTSRESVFIGPTP